MPSSKSHVLVLGAGNFGTCLGQHLAELGHKVTLWTIEEDVANAINQTRKNPKYFNEIILSERLGATNKISQKLLDSCKAIVLATPTQSMRQVLLAIKPFMRPELVIICAAKGIEIDTLELPAGVIAQTLGKRYGKDACFLSGPSFAIEVIHKLPTAVSMASESKKRRLDAQDLFHSNYFRVYTSNDPVGLGVAGALKNVVAIAAGATAGLGLQANSRAALLTRGLAEITRVGVAMGANPMTFNGLGGVGDLFLTCTSEKSRNFSVGFRLAKGEPLQAVLSSTGSVAEGVYTAKACHALCKKLKVVAPICEQVYEVLYENKPIGDALEYLLSREAREELE